MTTSTMPKSNARPGGLRRLASTVLLAGAALLVLIQFVPFGRDHTNPAVAAEPAWDSQQTRGLFMRACADCHSNETKWPWYTNVAPVSWLVQRDVNEGREKFNISMWGLQENEGDEAAENVRTGDMPPWFYLPPHPEAQLTPAEREQLIAGLAATFGDEGPEGGAGGERGGDDDD